MTKLSEDKAGPLIYKKLIKAKSLTPRTIKSQRKWLQDCNYSDKEVPFNWEPAYHMALTVHKKDPTD